jgi:hypothetical protein
MNAKSPMSPSDGSVKTLYLVPDRHCGSCTSCCKDLTIDSDELKKPPGVVCSHCVEAKGCGIYETRPTVCRSWFCGWRQMRNLDDSWRPDLCEILVTPAAEGHIPAGYPREGLTFELIGSLDRLTWPPSCKLSVSWSKIISPFSCRFVVRPVMSRGTSFSMTNWRARLRRGTGEPWSKGSAALYKLALTSRKRRSNSADPRKA